MKALPLLLAAVAFLLLPAAPVHALEEGSSGQESQSTAVPEDADKPAARSEKDDPNRKICKYVVMTGSRMGSKVCHTKAYWDEMELAARNKMREIDSQPISARSN